MVYRAGKATLLPAEKGTFFHFVTQYFYQVVPVTAVIERQFGKTANGDARSPSANSG